VLPKILLVEDDRLTRKLIKAGLKKISEVDFAEDGETAIKLAGKTIYPIILMDIALGYGIDGIEATKIIRKIPGYIKTPIVAVTAFAMIGDKEIFLSQGMTHYFPKPIKILDLQDLIIELLKEVNPE
jgi:CheY-like chemotaxis protein